MTSISALTPTYSASYVLADNLRTNASSRDSMITGDFQTLIKTQNKPASPSPDSVSTLSQQQSKESAISQKNVEALLLQMLASRKMLGNTGSKIGRSTSATLACNDLPDTDEIESECKDGNLICHTIRHFDFWCQGLGYNMPVGCAINITATPIMPSAYTVIWTPIDVIRRGPLPYASSRTPHRYKSRSSFKKLNEKKYAEFYGENV